MGRAPRIRSSCPGGPPAPTCWDFPGIPWSQKLDLALASRPHFGFRKGVPGRAAPSPPVPILALQHLGGSYAQEKKGSRESPAQSAEFPSLPLGHRASPLPTILQVGWKVPIPHL